MKGARPGGLLAYGWIAASIILQSGAMAFARQAGIQSDGYSALFIVVNPWFVGQLLCLALQAVTWIMALRQFSLSFAYPLMSLVFLCNLFFAVFCFGEVLQWNNVVGVAVIVGGAACISSQEST